MPTKIASEEAYWQIQPDDIMISSEISEEKQINTISHKNIENLNFKNKQLSSVLLSTVFELKVSKNELNQSKKDLQEVNKELFETNQALCALAKIIDNKKVEIEKQILQTIRSKIMPIIRELQNKDHMKKYLPELAVLSMHIENLVELQPHKHNIISSLTDKEMRVAALIKDGLTNSKIADMLFLSIETVKTHRKNIRKKLSLNNNDANLASYLKSII